MSFSLTQNILFGVVIFLVALLLSSSTYFYFEKLSFKEEIKKTQKLLSEEQTSRVLGELQADTCLKRVSAQNQSILELEINHKSAMSKLDEWKALPPRVKYETIYKIKEVKSNDCEDIKGVLDDARTIDFSRL